MTCKWDGVAGIARNRGIHLVSESQTIYILQIITSHSLTLRGPTASRSQQVVPAAVPDGVQRPHLAQDPLPEGAGRGNLYSTVGAARRAQRPKLRATDVYTKAGAKAASRTAELGSQHLANASRANTRQPESGQLLTPRLRTLAPQQHGRPSTRQPTSEMALATKSLVKQVNPHE